MTRDEACKMAAELSKANGKAYVIKVPDQGPGVGYDVVTDRDVDGHYIVVAYVNGYAVGGMIGGRRLIIDPAAPWPEHDTACGYSPTGRVIDPEAEWRHPVDVLKDIAETQGTPIDPEFEAAARELCDAPVSQLDRIRLVVAEWRKGCSVSDPQHAEQCSECTAGAMLAIEKILKED